MKVITGYDRIFVDYVRKVDRLLFTSLLCFCIFILFGVNSSVYAHKMLKGKHLAFDSYYFDGEAVRKLNLEKKQLQDVGAKIIETYKIMWSENFKKKFSDSLGSEQ